MPSQNSEEQVELKEVIHKERTVKSEGTYKEKSRQRREP